jgi:hypothetical protein
MMQAPRVHCAMAPHSRGHSKRAFNNNNDKCFNQKKTFKELCVSATKALCNSRSPASGSEFAVSLKTHENFALAVCIILGHYCLFEAMASIENEAPAPEVRAAR